jgi:hypothetical protein
VEEEDEREVVEEEEDPELEDHPEEDLMTKKKG